MEERLKESEEVREENILELLQESIEKNPAGLITTIHVGIESALEWPEKREEILRYLSKALVRFL